MDKLRWLTAFKAALASVIAIGIAMGLGWQKPYWAGISVMVVTLPYVGASLEKGIMRFFGTILAGVCIYLISGAFPQNQLGYALCLFGAITFAGYMSTGKFYPYTFFLGGITISIIGAQTFNNLESLWSVTYFRTSEICLGVLVALAVNALIFPQNAGRVLARKATDVMDNFARLLEHATSQYLDDKPTLDNATALEEKLSAQFPKLRALLPQAILDSSNFSHHRYTLQSSMQLLERTFVSIVTTLRSAESHYEKAYYKLLTDELRAYSGSLLQELRSLAHCLTTRTLPPDSTMAAMREAFEARLEELRAQGKPFTYKLEDTTQLMAFYANLCEVERSLTLLHKAVTALIQPGTNDSEFRERILKQRKKWRPDKRRLQHGLKTALAVVFALYAWQWWQYPGGLPSVITASIVMQKTTVASNQKSLLRLLGCLLGGICAALFLLFVTPLTSTYLQFAPFLFLCILLFGWINYGPQRYSYAGFQAMLAFLLMTSLSNVQSVSLKPGIERLFGIIFGVFICGLILRLIWPIIPERELRQTLKNFFSDCGQYLRLYTPRHLSGEAIIPAEQSLEGKLVDLPAVCQDWISQIGLTKDEEGQRTKYHELALSLQSLRFKLQAVERVYRRNLTPALIDRISPALLELNEQLANNFDAFAAAFATGTKPEFFPELDSSMRTLNRELLVMMRKEHLSRSHRADEVAQFLALVRRYRDLTSEARNCQTLISGLDLKILDRSPFF